VGNAQSFAIMGGTAVNANGIGSLITGDVGIAPAAGSFITGFPANATVVPPFSVRGNDSTAIAARASITALNTSLISAAPSGANSLPELGGASFGPGVYNFAAQATLSAGSLTLTTPGLYIFKVGSFLTAATTTHVLLGAGVDPCNVFWQVTSLATLNGVNFVGNVVADAGIHLGTGATLTGRALATTNGDVTLAGSGIIGGCSAAAGPVITLAPATLPNGTVGVPFSQTLTGSGGTAPFSFSVTAGALPAGVTLTPAGTLGLLSGTPTAPGTSTFTIRVTDVGGFFAERPFTMAIATGVPTLPQAFVLVLALGLTAVGYFRLRRRDRAK
jgi:type VI secretion system secreted protein VgrG